MSRRRAAPAQTSELDALTPDQLQELNDSFNSVFRKDAPSPSKRRRVDSPQHAFQGPSAEAGPNPAPGGFIIDQDFVIPGSSVAPESTTPADTDQDLIPLREIPRLLDIMNLPSDAEVLAAFETGAQSDDEERGTVSILRGELVSRINFLRVCAVLLGNRSQDDSDSASEAPRSARDGEETGSEASFAPSDQDEGGQTSYRRATRSSRRRGGGGYADLQMLDDEISEDEAGVHRATSSVNKSKSKKGKGKARAQDGMLSASQQRKAVDLFAAFLPEDTQPEERSWEAFSQRSLGIKEIRHVATLVRISLTDKEIHEMLEMASTGSSDRVSMADFVRVLQQIHAV